jgi:hypothetical protein
LQGDALGQFGFQGAAGSEVGDDGVTEGVPLGGVLAGQDGAFGAQAVLDGVETGAFLAGFGGRTGAVAGHGSKLGLRERGGIPVVEPTANP